MKRFLLLAGAGLAILVAGGGAYLGYRSSSSRTSSIPAAPPTLPAEVGDVVFTVTGPGLAVDTGQMTLESRVNGRVERLSVRPGDPVEAGQSLVSLGERADFETARQLTQTQALEAQQALEDLDPAGILSQAELNVFDAQTELDKARRTRANAEYPRGSQASIEMAKVDYFQAEEQLTQAEKIYNNLSWLSEDDPQRVQALSQAATARKQRDRAKVNLNYLQSKPTPAEVDAAQARVNLAQSSLAQAQAALKRAQAGQSTPILLAKAKLDQAQSALAAAQADLDSLEVTAPFSGVVLNVAVQQGQSVASGAPLVVLTRPTDLEVQISVVEEDLPLVQPGQHAALFFDALPTQDLWGTISRLVPQRISPEQANYPVYIRLDRAPEGLVAGMNVDATITIAEKTGVLRLPRSVIRSLGDDQAEVEVWTGSAVEKRVIQVGLRGDTYVEVLSGLQAGELVVAQ